MQRIISVILTLAMIASAMTAMTITADANATWLGVGSSTWSGNEDGSGIDHVEALYFENEPTIDGYVTEAEWGKRTIEMYSEDLNTRHNPEPYFNSFFYWKGADDAASLYPMAALIWLRWDENYFYVAAIVNDRNGHSLKKVQRETWNGDAIGFRIDSQGANAATFGNGYDPDIGTPWSDPATVPDIYVGYCQIAGGYTEVYENANDKGLTEYSNPVFGAVKAVVAPSERNSDIDLEYTEDTAAGYTTYEVAIPWKYIYENNLVDKYDSLTDAEKAPYVLDYSEYSRPMGNPDRPNYKPGNLKGGIGQNLGMSIVVFDAGFSSSTHESFMSWGSGVASVQTDIAPQTCAGSNQVTLVAEKVQQGEYDKYDPSKLEAPAINKEYDNVFYDYLGGDTDRETPLNDASMLKTLTYENIIPSDGSRTYEIAEDQEYWGSADLYAGSVIDVGGEHGYVLNYDRVIVTHEDEEGTVFEAGVDPIDQFYIDTVIGYDDYWNAIGGRYPLSYTFEFDVMYTGTETVQEGRAPELGNLFGGNSVGFYCGYSFEDSKFIISKFSKPDEIIAESAPYEFQKDTWYNWKFQYDNETCQVRLLINNEVVLDVNNRYFYHYDQDILENGTLLCWWFINTQIKMDNVKIYNFYDYNQACSISGTVTANITDDTTSSPIIVNLYQKDSEEIYKTVTLESTGGYYEFTTLVNDKYTVEFTKNGCVTQRYHIAMNSSSADCQISAVLNLLGDVNLDGTVNSVDFLFVKLSIVGIKEKDIIFDVNGDAYVNAKDMLIIKKIIMNVYY
ncbi:MAG: hypothetical protein IKL36_07560 [Clostridia bacterium]|nr:hypothetical protein [Clostridia bacterium]